MDRRELGQTGVLISPLGLGTVKFGRNEQVKYPQGFEIPDEAFLTDLLALARELGINTLDTAPAYGTSEERLGRLLKGQRQDWVIIGKAGEEFEAGRSYHDFTPAHIEKSLTRSLKRLNTDYLDVLLLHSDGNDTDILRDDVLIKTLQSFKERGLVRAVGASTKTVEGGLMALELLDIAMIAYNPAYREEEPVLDYAAAHGKGALLKKALSSGHIDQFEGADPVEAAMRFAFAHPGVTGLIVGTINPDHLRHNVQAAIKALRQKEAQHARLS